MPNRKIKHIVATLVGAQTEETLDVYDIDAVHKSDLTTALNVTESGKAADARALKTINDKFANYIAKDGNEESATMNRELFQRHASFAKGGGPAGEGASSSRGIRFYDNSGTFDQYTSRLGGLEHIVMNSTQSFIALTAYHNVANPSVVNYGSLRVVMNTDGTTSPVFVDFGKDRSDAGATSGASYPLWTAENAPHANYAWSSRSINNEITANRYFAFGELTNGSTTLRFFVPYNVVAGSPTLKSLEIQPYIQGYIPYARSGSTGQTYTQLSGPISVWETVNGVGRSTRTNEVSQVTIEAKVRSGFYIVVTFTYPLAISDGGSTISNVQAAFMQLNMAVDLN